jgi:hypothetical protein
MGYSIGKYKVRVRTVVVGEVTCTSGGYDEPQRRSRAVHAALKKSRQVQIRNARRPLAGGECEVITIEPVGTAE